MRHPVIASLILFYLNHKSISVLRALLAHLFFSAVFFSFAPVYAQNFSGRLILGMNGSQIDGDGMSGYYKAGLVAGAGVHFPVNDRLSFGSEIMYSMKGSKASFDQITELGYPAIVYQLNYINIPVVAEYQIAGGFLTEAGFSYGRLLNARLDNGTNLGFVDAEFLFKKSDFLLLAGLKYEVFDNIWLSGRLLYSIVSTNALGITSINYGLAGAPSRGGFFNNLLQFSLSMHLFGQRLEKPGSSEKSSSPVTGNVQ
jgi:hypothetical protein